MQTLVDMDMTGQPTTETKGWEIPKKKDYEEFSHIEPTKVIVVSSNSNSCIETTTRS